MTLRTNILQEADKTRFFRGALSWGKTAPLLLRCFGEISSASHHAGHGSERLVLPEQMPADTVLCHALGNDIRVNAIKANRLLREQRGSCCCIPMETTQWEYFQIRSHHPAPNSIFACASGRKKTHSFITEQTYLKKQNKGQLPWCHRRATLKAHKSQLIAQILMLIRQIMFFSFFLIVSRQNAVALF